MSIDDNEILKGLYVLSAPALERENIVNLECLSVCRTELPIIKIHLMIHIIWLAIN